MPVCIAAGLAWVGALRRRPYRRDLVWLGGLLPLGVLCQAVLGGLTVRGKLDYGWVMGHFALSMLILVAAAALAWRAAHDPGERPRDSDRTLVWSTRALVALGALTIFAGTAATAAGPHAGGNPGERINRLDFDGRGTMDFVIHRHAEIALVFSLLAVCVWWLARRRSTDPARASLHHRALRPARPAGRSRLGPVRDPPTHRAGVGSRRPRLRLLAGCAVGRVRCRAPPEASRRAPGGGSGASRSDPAGARLGLNPLESANICPGGTLVCPF